MLGLKTVGLFEEDTLIYYIDKDVVVANNPYNGGHPTVFMLKPGPPVQEAVHKALKTVKMALTGEPQWRKDGLWYQEVKEASDG